MLIHAQIGAAMEGAVQDQNSSTTHSHFIERRNQRGLVDRRMALASFLADARLLATADAFVGTGSWTSRILLLAVIGGRAAVPPYVLLDGPLGDRLWGGKGKDCSKKVCK